MSKLNYNAADTSAMLSMYAYLDVQYPGLSNMSLWDALQTMKANGRINAENEGYYNTLVNACRQRPELRDLRLISQSHVDGISTQSIHGKSVTDDTTPAVAFKDKDGNIYVAYRGTGDGRWMDNGKGFVGPPTRMQKDAAKYLDYVAKNHNGKIYVSGHSKGGNLAQYASLTSKYKDRIDQVYSFDGQGFSRQVIEQLKKDPSYNKMLSKLYSINGDNDPVHNLIGAVIPGSNTYFVHTYFKDATYCHDLRGMVKEGKIKWMRDKNGNITHGKEGFTSEYFKNVNKNLMMLPEKDQKACAMGLMAVLEFISFHGLNKYSVAGMEGKHANMGDFAKLFGIGGPVILFSFGETVLKDLYSKYGLMGAVAFGLGVGCFMPLIMAGVFGMEVVALTLTVAERALELVEKARQICTQITDWAINTFNQIDSVINSFIEWCCGILVGSGEAGISPLVVIDTNTMVNYANQLKNISRKAKNLDRRMNSLYFQMGIDWTTIFKLGSLLKAEFVMKYALRLDSCARALENTANDFNRVERELANI